MKASPPTISTSRGTTVPVCLGMEAYNERSFCVKYRSQGVQTSFYESTPSASDSLGNSISQKVTEDSANARANFPNASEERNLRNISRNSGFYSNVFLVRKASGGWRPVIDLKQLNHHIDAPHFRMHTISWVLSPFERGDYAFKIYLPDA